MPRNEAVRLKVPKCLGQHLLRDVLQKTPQLVETHTAVLESKEDEDGPLVGHTIDHLARGTARTEDIEGKCTFLHAVTSGYLYHFRVPSSQKELGVLDSL